MKGREWVGKVEGRLKLRSVTKRVGAEVGRGVVRVGTMGGRGSSDEEGRWVRMW